MSRDFGNRRRADLLSTQAVSAQICRSKTSSSTSAWRAHVYHLGYVFRRVATRYDKPARNFLSAVHLTAAVAFWL